MTLTYNPLQAIVMTYSHAKVQGQRSVGSKDRGRLYTKPHQMKRCAICKYCTKKKFSGQTNRWETNRPTEAIALPDTLMQSVNIMIKQDAGPDAGGDCNVEDAPAR